MIRRIGLRNLKAFTHLDVRCRPLTVLSGLNGSGKSTVVQALLLARSASLATGGSISAVNSDAGLLLGNAIDLLNRNSDDEIIRIEIVEQKLFEWVFQPAVDDGANLAIRSGGGEGPSVLKDVTFLAAERNGPRLTEPISYSESNSNSVGVDGRFTAWVLASSDRLEVLPRLRFPGEPTPLLRRQAEAWMSAIVGPVQFEAGQVPRTDIATLYMRHANQVEWTLPTNTGFGYTYLLPVVVGALIAPPKSLLVVESPEAHLHPAAQSMVGRFLATLVYAGIQVVVETHSEHVVNGVRRGFLDLRMNPKDVVFHYFDREDEREISLRADGSLDDWPVGFFDQTRVDLASIVQRRSLQ